MTKNVMHQWFMHLFQQRMDDRNYVRCFECNRLLPEEVYKDMAICYSHILSKKTYPKYAGDPNNIEIVCPDCHTLYTVKPKNAVKQYSKYLRLKQLYNVS